MSFLKNQPNLLCTFANQFVQLSIKTIPILLCLLLIFVNYIYIYYSYLLTNSDTFAASFLISVSPMYDSLTASTTTINYFASTFLLRLPSRYLPSSLLWTRTIWRRSMPLRGRLERTRMRHSRNGLQGSRLLRARSMRTRFLQMQRGLER